MWFKKRPEVVADVFNPARRFLDFCKLYEQVFGFYPLWIVPYRVPMPNHGSTLSFSRGWQTTC